MNRVFNFLVVGVLLPLLTGCPIRRVAEREDHGRARPKNQLEDFPLTPRAWGESGSNTKWLRYPFKVASDYKYVETTPGLEQFPELLELAEDPRLKGRRKGGNDRSILVDQLRSLSRCQFQDHLFAASCSEEEYLTVITKYRRWWNRYGKQYAAEYRTKGKRYPQAWREIAGAKNLPCPNYPVLLPEAWSTRLKFRSGDYAGMVDEEIQMKVNKSGCTLTRRYRIGAGWPGNSGWISERWKNLSRAESQTFMATLIYAIDNPWLYREDPLIQYESYQTVLGSIRGRPSDWSDYYPAVQWSGILAADGTTILNDDPNCWHTADVEQMGNTSLEKGIGVVFRVFRDLFPDPSWRPNESRWGRLGQKQADPCID